MYQEGIRHRSRFGVRVKFTILVTSLLAISVIILSGVLIYHISNSLQDELKEKGVLLAKRIASNSVYGVMIGDTNILRGFMEEIKSEPDLAYAIVLDAGGKVLAHTDSKEVGKVFNDPLTIRYLSKKDLSFEKVSLKGEMAFYISVPIFSKDLKVGSAIICLSSKGVMERTKKIFYVGLGSTTIIIFFAGLLSYLLIGIVIRPIEEMAWAAEEIAGGVFTRRLDIPSDDEIGILASSFNNMLDHLKKKDKELRQNIEELKLKIEELRSVQEQLIQSTKLAAIGELAAHIAHEINNPLTGILGYASLLMENEIDQAKRNQLKTIEGEALRTREVVKKLLDFARQTEPKTDKVNINHVVKGVVTIIMGPARASNIQIIEKYSEGLPEILIDVNQIEQVFMNIINNSMDAMPDGGILTIKSYHAGRYVAVSISDNGIGIPTDMLQRIFEPFFTTKKQVSGTGLGLSVSLGIVERHGGRIDVESQAGKGSRFTISLPLEEIKV